MRTIFTLLVFLLAGLNMLAQQDPQYNLYQFNQMVINPAYAGARDGISAVAATRKQWAGFDGSPQTTCFSAHTPILKKNIGVGLTLVNDIMGPRNVTSIYGNFAYILKLNSEFKLSFGMNAGYNKYQFNFNEIKFKQGEVPAALLAVQNPAALDINSGIFLRSKTFFFGLTTTHLNSPNIYTYTADSGAAGKFVYKIKTHLFVTLGKSFIVDKNVVFAPTALIKVVGSSYGADLNLNFFLYKKIWLGAFYRYGYGPGALMQYYITNRFRVSYSYDSGVSDARRLGGSHEVMIGVDIPTGVTKPKMINPRFL